MRKNILLNIVAFFVLLIFINCGHFEPLPKVGEAEQGDTSYVQIFPNWEQDAYNFQSPKDVLVGNDGYIFVADSGNGRIVVLDQAGFEISKDEYGNDFNKLSEINISDKGRIEPLRLNQDSKMNLLIADGSNQVYAWNQHFNNVGIKAVAKKYWLKNNNTNNTIVLNEIDSLPYYMENEWSIVNAEFEENEELIENLLAPHVFFDGNDMRNILLDTYGDTRNSKIVDVVAFGKDYSNGMHMLDKRYNRIVRLKYVPKHLLFLEDSSVVFNYEAVFSEVVTGQGTGAGFVMDPKSISLDESGNIYYTQTGGSFSCHGISVGSSRSIFSPNENEILDLNRFDIAYDISIDSRATIYVVDAGKNLIQTFNGQGQFQRNIGTVVIDTSYAESDSLYQVEIAEILNRPESVDINENTVYIADTGNSRIVRFQYVILAEQNQKDNYSQEPN